MCRELGGMQVAACMCDEKRYQLSACISKMEEGNNLNLFFFTSHLAREATAYLNMYRVL